MCGIVGVFDINQPVTIITSDMMTALQYRGEQSAGVAIARKEGKIFSLDKTKEIFVYERALGPVGEIFRKICPKTKTENFVASIGHLRYGTCGDRDTLINAQPFFGQSNLGAIFLAHNGDTPNLDSMTQDLISQEKFVHFESSSDSELILQFILRSKENNLIEAIKSGLERYKGTYALVMLTYDEEGIKLIAARDPSGNRPLSLGRLNGGYLVASEDLAFERVNGTFEREIKPGEMLILSYKKYGHSREHKNLLRNMSQKNRTHQCVFEEIYFSSPGSNTFNLPVWQFRETLGKKAARLFGGLVEEYDVITNPPDSSNFFADGFAKGIGKNLERVFIRHHSSIIRSFTQDTPDKRYDAIRKKMSIIGKKVENKRVWLLDDSIVRGNTSRKLIRSLKANGAVWVGVISSAPPIIGPCHKGIDFINNELVAAKYLKKEVAPGFAKKPNIGMIRKEIEADFLGYLTLDDLKDAIEAFEQNPKDFCLGCFTGHEPIWGNW